MKSSNILKHRKDLTKASHDDAESNSESKAESDMKSDAKSIVQQGYFEIPSFVFRDRSVAVLECMVEYMKDNRSLTFHEIAVLLNRDDRTIWTVYRRAKLKRKGLIRNARR
jgi:hypothetical protein